MEEKFLSIDNQGEVSENDDSSMGSNKQKYATISQEKKRSRKRKKKKKSKIVQGLNDDEEAFNRALVAMPDPEPTIREGIEKNDGAIESFLVSRFKNEDVQAMKENTVECIFESLVGGLGCFRFKKAGLIGDDGFSAQVSQGIQLSCPPFDKLNMVVPVCACKFKNLNNTIQNIGDSFNQLRYIIIKDGNRTTVTKCAAIMVKVSTTKEWFGLHC
jgi:hypothetical protein